MPQVRDPKTGRYTSGGGSSVGGAAGTNPRIQKAKAVGGGATAGGASPASQGEYHSIDSKGKVSARNGGSMGDAVEDITGKSMFEQRDAVSSAVEGDVEIETLNVKSATAIGKSLSVEYEYSGYSELEGSVSGTATVKYNRDKGAGSGGAREQARAIERKASALERELNIEMSSTGEGKHSVGWRREQQKEIDRLRSEAQKLLYG